MVFTELVHSTKQSKKCFQNKKLCEDFHITRPNLVSDSTINYRNSCERFKYVEHGWYLLKSSFLFTSELKLVRQMQWELSYKFGSELWAENCLLAILWLFLSKLICWRIVYKHLRASKNKSAFICVFICESTSETKLSVVIQFRVNFGKYRKCI